MIYVNEYLLKFDANGQPNVDTNGIPRKLIGSINQSDANVTRLMIDLSAIVGDVVNVGVNVIKVNESVDSYANEELLKCEPLDANKKLYYLDMGGWFTTHYGQLKIFVQALASNGLLTQKYNCDYAYFNIVGEEYRDPSLEVPAQDFRVISVNSRTGVVNIDDIVAEDVASHNQDTTSHHIDQVKLDIATLDTNKVNTSDIVDALTSIDSGKPLSAKQGKVLYDLITTLSNTVSTINAALGNKVGTSDIVNDTTSGGVAKVLSAEQGKLLQVSLSQCVTAISNLNTIVGTGGADADDIINSVAEVYKFVEQFKETTDILLMINNKVEKVAGKSLIADTEIARLLTLVNYDDETVNTHIANADIHITALEKSQIQTNKNDIASLQTNKAPLVHEHDYEPKNANIQAHIGTTSGNPHNVKYADLPDKPTIPNAYDDTTLSGRVTTVENALPNKANSSEVYTKTEVDSKVSTDINTHDQSSSAHLDLFNAITTRLMSLESIITNVDGVNDVDTVIDKLHEIVALLDGYAEGTTLANLLSGYVLKDGTKVLSENNLTNTLKSNYDSAYTHSQSAHAPSGAQANVIEGVQVNGVDLTVTSKKVNVVVPSAYDDTALAGRVTAVEDDIMVDQANSIPTTLVAGKSYYGTLSANLTIATLTDLATSNKLNQWHFVAIMGATPYTVSFTPTIKWATALPTFAANKIYEFSITKVDTSYIGVWCAYA